MRSEVPEQQKDPIYMALFEHWGIGPAEEYWRLKPKKTALCITYGRFEGGWGGKYKSYTIHGGMCNDCIWFKEARRVPIRIVTKIIRVKNR